MSNEPENEEVYLFDEEDNSNEEPSEEEIMNYAIFLGFDLKEDEEYLDIAKNAMRQPVPENWKRAFLKISNRMCYFDTVKQTFHHYSPTDEAALKEYEMRKQEKLRKIQQQKVQHHNIPKVKNLPPVSGKKEKLGPIKNKEIEENSMKNKSFNDSETNSPVKQTNPVHEVQIENISPVITQKKNESKVINNPQNHETNENEKVKKLKKKKKKEPIVENQSEVIIQNQVQPQTLKKESQKNLEIKKENTTQLKNEYFQQKLQEIQDFRELLYLQYQQDEIKLEDEFNNIHDKYEKYINNKLENQLKLVENETKEKIKNFEENIKTEAQNNLEFYSQTLEHENNIKSEHELNQINSTISKLTGDRNFLKNEIETISQNKQEDSLNNFHHDLHDTKVLLEDKYNIDLKNLQTHFHNLDLEMENEEQMNFNRDVELIKSKFEGSRIRQSRLFQASYNKILEDFKKSLEEEYKNQSKFLLKENQMQLENKFISFRKEIEIEVKEKEESLKINQKEIELDYQKEILKSKEETKNASKQKEKIIIELFELTIKSSDELKLNINNKIKEVVNLFFNIFTESARSNYDDRIEDKLKEIYDENVINTKLE